MAGLALAGAWSSPGRAAGQSPNDPFFPRQWGLVQVGAPQAWSRSTGAGIDIGIVDTGVDSQQEDLAGKVVASANCIGSGGSASKCTGSGADDNGHGTHVAGIAAALTNNGKGVAGVAPSARLVVAKVIDSSGSGNLDDVDAGIEWVVNHGARVVNLSLAELPQLGGLVSGGLSSGVDYAWQHGAVAVIAAGNQDFFGLGSSNYGNANAVIVGATGPNDQVAAYSRPVGNAKWSLVAPGGAGTDANGNATCSGPPQASCIISTWWSASDPTNEYAYDQGTSMATPVVSAALALLLAQGLSPLNAVNTLLATADKSVSCGSGCSGRLDAARAVGASVSQSTHVAPGSGSPSGSTAGTSPGTTGAAPGPRSSPSLAPGVGGTGSLPAPSVPPPPTSTAPAPALEPSGARAVVSRPEATGTFGRHVGRRAPPYFLDLLAAALLVGVAAALGYLRDRRLTVGVGR